MFFANSFLIFANDLRKNLLIFANGLSKEPKNPSRRRLKSSGKRGSSPKTAVKSPIQVVAALWCITGWVGISLG